MADNLVDPQTGGTSPQTVPLSMPGDPVPATAPPPEPVVDESDEEVMRADLERLEKSDWMTLCLKRFSLGAHPDPATEALLKRRLDFSGRGFQAAYPLRVICSLAMVLVVSSVAWTGLWLVFSFLGFTDFIRELSVLMSLLLFALFGIAATHPMKMFDEQALEKAGSDSIRLLRLEIAEKAKANDRQSPS
jgi:hypothetical protein